MLITLAAIQSATLRDKFGFSVETELAQLIIDNPVAYESAVPQGNVPLTCAPAISIGKNFDTEKAAYITVSVSADKKYLNLKLTNIKPEKEIATKEIAALFTTRYNASNADQVKAAALKAAIALK